MAANKSVPLACGVGHNNHLERAAACGVGHISHQLEPATACGGAGQTHFPAPLRGDLLEALDGLYIVAYIHSTQLRARHWPAV